MVKPVLSHYSPTLANKAWAHDGEYISYSYHPYKRSVEKSLKGWKEWGRMRKIYSQAVEDSLNHDLENHAAPIYEKILAFGELSAHERLIWTQFLLSQLVRTPTFMRYEKAVRSIFGVTETPRHDRVGCPECLDLKFVANRNWCLVIAHDGDFFVRTDNPVFQSGFIERPETCVIYPMSPKVCFVACSMPPEWDAYSSMPSETRGFALNKGGAHLINFHLARSADESLIINPNHDGNIAESMYGDMLGLYPQPPFALHRLQSGSIDEDAYESIRMIMSKVDGCAYPKWDPSEIEPFY